MASGRDIAAGGRAPRVAFLSTMCVLDPVSGAALDVRAMLETLAAAGFEASSFTGSLFDQNDEVPFAPILGRDAAAEANRGKVLRLARGGVRHNVFLTGSSRGANMSREEQARMAEVGRRMVREHIRPDVVISYGSSALSRGLRDAAREAGATIVHFLANAELDPARVVSPRDRILCPSEFLARLYAGHGHAPKVLRSIVAETHFLAPEAPRIAAEPARRRLGLVTFVNPIPHKGLTLMARLVRRALAERPEMTFAVVEGRMTRELARRAGLDLSAMANVLWIAPQSDLRRIYARTSVLLMPSYWREGFGRCAVEAQLSGIPVIASTQGGLTEALGGGGLALDIPAACAENHYAMPDDATVDRWWRALLRLWDDDAAYAEAQARAREAAARFHPEATRAAVRDHFAALAGASAGGRA
jgi:glycosyltransferase involved in cell wall biosynthesis